MILYNVYDTETNEYICRGLNCREVSEMLSCSPKNVNRTMIMGYLIHKRYRLEEGGRYDYDHRVYGQVKQQWVDEWDEVTRKAREWFAYMRGKK